jgi:hypothetical protein
MAPPGGAAAGPKEFYAVPNASHVGLHNRTDLPGQLFFPGAWALKPGLARSMAL